MDQRSASHSRPRLREGVSATSSKIALLGFQLSGGELETPLHYQIPLAEGRSDAPLALPEGAGYELVVRGYDLYGKQTHQGVTTLEVVREGENEPVRLELAPVATFDRREKFASTEPSAVDLPLVGEKRLPSGTRLVIEAGQKEPIEGMPAHFRAFAVDLEGRRLELDPADFHWSVSDPRFGHFDPRLPPDNGWSHFTPGGAPDYAAEFDVIVTTHDKGWRFPTWALPNPYVDVSAGNGVTCALRRLGQLSCWGNNLGGMLGDSTGGTTQPDTCSDLVAIGKTAYYRCTPVQVAGSLTFSAVSVGGSHVCAIAQVTNLAFCWGNNNWGQLGTLGYASGPRTPVAEANGLAIQFASISVGGSHSCGTTTSGQALCWGYNGFAQLGAAPNTGLNAVPTAFPFGGPVGGANFSCGLDSGAPRCFGAAVNNPVLGAGSLSTIGQGSTASHACGINSGREVRCWGRNDQGQLGEGSTNYNAMNPAGYVLTTGTGPTGTKFLADVVAAGSSHSCALDASTPYCWGSNRAGQIGNGATFAGGTSLRPTRLARAADGTTLFFVRITAGAEHSCGLVADGRIYCWGLNEHGQLGIGRSTGMFSAPVGNSVPMRVVGS